MPVLVAASISIRPGERPPGVRVAQRLHHVLLPDQAGEIARPPFAGEDLVAHRTILAARGVRRGRRRSAGAPLSCNSGEPDPGTCSARLWLLPSGPDQVHQAAMRGGPPLALCTTRGA